MKHYLQKKFALTEQGAKDLVKAIVACCLVNISLMFPVGIIYLFLEHLLVPYFGDTVNMGLPAYIVFSTLVLAVLFLFSYIQYNATYVASYTESASLRITLAERLRRLPLSFFGQRDLSDLTTTIMTDTAFIEQSFSHFIPELFGAIISTILVAIGMFCYNWQMSLAVFWVVPVSFLLALGTRPLVNKLERRQKDKKLAASDGIQECIENIQDIKANNQRDTYLEDLDIKIVDVEKATIGTEWINGTFVTAAQMVLKLGMATTVLVGVKLMLAGTGDFFLLLIFLIAATRIYEPLESVLINLSAVFSTLLVVERMKTINEEPIKEGESEMKNQGYDLCFKHVGFAYHTGEKVLEDVSFIARQGEVTALVGPSGGGKSTAARLAARFWDIQSGIITLGGVNIQNVDPEVYLKNFSIVFQDVVLFNNTIIENIRLGKRGASDEEVMAAAKAAQCDEFVSRMPEGYETMIGENGSALSGGERQRISIARALLKDAPVVFLDEATASLDVENESLVQNAISRLVKNKTVLIIAHRMRTVAGADKVVVLSEGHVAEQGTPSELMKAGGLYQHMVDLQTESLEWKL